MVRTRAGSARMNDSPNDNMSLFRTPAGFGAVGDNPTRPTGSNNNTLGVAPLGDGGTNTQQQQQGSTGAIPRNPRRSNQFLRNSNSEGANFQPRRSLQLPPVLTPQGAVGNTSTPQAGGLDSGHLPPAGNVAGQLLDVGQGAPFGNVAGQQVGNIPNQPHPQNRAAPLPFGTQAFQFPPPWYQPPPPPTTEAQPNVNDIMRLMMEENRRRDMWMERLLTGAQWGNRAPANDPGLCYQVMPDLSKNIDAFDGEGRPSSAREWLTMLDSMRTLHRWPDNIALETARMRLTGGARDWYRMHAYNLQTWEDFREIFVRTFVTHESLASKWQRMAARAQAKEESTQTYFHAKVKLCVELNLDVNDTKEQVLVGLWSKDCCNAMAARVHRGHEELYHDILSYEKLENQRIQRIKVSKPLNTEKGKPTTATKSATPQGSVSVPSPSTPGANLPIKNEAGEFKCFNCNQYGHLSRECKEPKRDLFCRNCKQKGHSQGSCTATASPPTVNQIFTCGLSTLAKYLKSVGLDTHSVQGQVDQGSSDCTITVSTALLLGLRMEPRPTELRSFGPENFTVTSPGRTYTDAPNVDYHKVGGNLTFTDAEASRLQNEGQKRAATINVDATSSQQLPANSIQLVRVVDRDHEYELPTINFDAHAQTLCKGTVLRCDDITELPTKFPSPRRTTIQREDLIVGENQQEEVIEDLVQVLNEYRDCIASNLDELGCTNVIEMDIDEVPNSRPVFSKPYRASVNEREEMRDIVGEWKRAGIVTETNSPYASPVLLVRKKSGESRLVVDFRRLNRQTERTHFPLPDIDDHVALVGNAKLFITLDLAHGYLQVPLSKNARAKTAFITPDDTGEFTRMTFGLMNAPFYFSKLMQRVLGPLRNKVILFYLDDILLPGRDWPDLRDRLIQVLEALRKAGLTLKLPKCQFLMDKITYLGYVISKDGIEPGPSKLRGIIDFPRPKDVHEVRRFLGLTSFFRRFVLKFAERAEPLTRLLKKNCEFTWGEAQDRSFVDLKETLGESPILQLYNPKRKTELHTDASALGLAAMLFQEGDDGRMHLVYAISRRTNEAERNYHSSKLELLAIVWAVTRLRTLLINIPFKVVSDCQALVYLSANKTKNPQIVRWYTTLSEYDFEIEHRPGERMAHVDALSRAPAQDVNDECEMDASENTVYTIVNPDDEVRVYQCTDDELRRKCDILGKRVGDRSAHERNEIRGYELIAGLLYKRIDDELKYVIPRALRKSLAVRFHDMQSHTGVDRTIQKMRAHYFFPGMRAYIKRHVRACLQCIMSKALTGKQAGMLHPIPPGQRPFETINIDHEGPFVTSARKNKYVFAAIDNLTKYVVLKAVRDTAVNSVVRVLEDFVLDFGAPRRIISDRGTAFTSKKFAAFVKKHGIEHVLNSPRHAQANGQIERLNRTLLPAIQANVQHEDGRDWDVRLKAVQRDLNESPSKTTGVSPFRALFGFTPSHDEGGMRRLHSPEGSSYRLPEEVQQEVHERISEEQDRYKNRYDKRRRCARFNIGDIVYMKAAPVQTGESQKLQRKFRGPLAIDRILRGDTYGVTDLAETETGRRYASTAHADQLKLWEPPLDEGPDNRPLDETEVEDDDNESGDDERDPADASETTGVDEIISTGTTEQIRPPESELNAAVPEPRRSTRVRKAPTRLREYELNGPPEDE